MALLVHEWQVTSRLVMQVRWWQFQFNVEFCVAELDLIPVAEGMASDVVGVHD